MNESKLKPTEYLEKIARREIKTAVEAYKNDSSIYESNKKMAEHVASEYKERVLYELIQNARDAHDPGDDKGRIAIKLVVRSDDEAELYVANGGSGFREREVEAISNLAMSSKDVRKDIGNKGLGFKSIQTLTDDVKIFSQQKQGKERASKFDGFCFYFPSENEIKNLIESYFPSDSENSGEVANTIPRFRVPQPLKEQSKEITEYARMGYATVIALPLRTQETVESAIKQVEALTESYAPLLLFLDRIEELQIDIKQPETPCSHYRLYQQREPIKIKPKNSKIYKVNYKIDKSEGKSEERNFLVVRREIDKDRIKEEYSKAYKIDGELEESDWKNWQPEVSVAVGLSASTIKGNGRLYNFLPMGESAHSPFIGYLDAPFKTRVDRRNISGDSFNETLIEIGAEICAEAALHIVEHKLPIPPQAVFDLFAWTEEHKDKFKIALKNLGTSLLYAPVIPVIAERGNKWASLSNVRIWPEEGNFAVLKDKAIAKHAGASLFSGKGFDRRRIERLEQLARQAHEAYEPYYPSPLLPLDEELVTWVEIFAQYLWKRKVAKRTWSGFYNDISKVFTDCKTDLESLVDRKIFLVRQSGKQRLVAAEPNGVYTSPPNKKEKSKELSVPQTLARRYSFLDNAINIKNENLFIEAKLIRKYEPAEILSGLKVALGEEPTGKRREEALVLAFDVWQLAGGEEASERIKTAIKEAELYLPTQGKSWQLAHDVMFSSSWTELGKTLENYLETASELSEDCEHARGFMLNWDVPESERDRWTKFLKLIGVTDGLKALSPDIKIHGTPYHCSNEMQKHEEFGSGWITEITRIVSSLYSRRVDYETIGEVWHLPGQILYENFSPQTKKDLCELIFAYLKPHEGISDDTNDFQFEIARFNKYGRYRDERKLPTPLATFLRTQDWVSIGLEFRRPDECWAYQKNDVPPRFIENRLSKQEVDFSKYNESSKELVFYKYLGIRDWSNKDSALARLKALADVAKGVEESDRKRLREECGSAWDDIVESGSLPPDDLNLVVNRGGNIDTLSGDADAPVEIIVVENKNRLMIKLLSGSNKPILEIGDSANKDEIAAILERTGCFNPRTNIDVKLCVDDKPFVSSDNDESLVSGKWDWLREIIIIGQAIKSKEDSDLKAKIQSVRIRHCATINLTVEEESQSPEWYTFEDENYSTLILTDKIYELSIWSAPEEVLESLLRLIDKRLEESLSLPLLKLARHYDKSHNHPQQLPDNEILAKAFSCSIREIEEARAELRRDIGHIMKMLEPLVVYYSKKDVSGDIALLQRLQTDCQQFGGKFKPEEWIKYHLSEHKPEEIFKACTDARDYAYLHKELKLDFARFNRALQWLEEPTLSYREELDYQFKLYKSNCRSEFIDRLRRRYFGDFEKDGNLTNYIEQKGLLDAITFDEIFDDAWVLTHETLEQENFNKHLEKFLTEKLGEDRQIKLPTLEQCHEANRKIVLEFAKEALPILQSWQNKNSPQVELPSVWYQYDRVAWHLENKGFLDFKEINRKDVPNLCRRADCWPDKMPETLELSELELSKDDLKDKQYQTKPQEINHQASEARPPEPSETEIRERIKQQGEQEYSVVAPRSQYSPDRKLTGGGNTDSSYRSNERENGDMSDTPQTEDERQEIGRRGEWIAYCWLKERHSNDFLDIRWESKNRIHYIHDGNQGDDMKGYDFQVLTKDTEWLYEIKSSKNDSYEFEMTENEMRVAEEATKSKYQRYCILYIPNVFSDSALPIELPNPMDEEKQDNFEIVKRGTVRFRSNIRLKN